MNSVRSLYGILKVDIKRSVFSKSFAAFLILTAFIYFASGYIEFTKYAQRAPNLDVLYFFDFLHSVGAFRSMLVLCCVFPFGASFCTEWNKKSIRFFVIRSGKSQYCISKIVACAMSGGLVISLGVLLFCLLVSLKYPLLVENGIYQSYLTSYEAHIQRNTSPAFTTAILVNGNIILFFLTNMYLIFLYGAFWSVVGLCVSAYIPNIFVTLFSPFILSFMEVLVTGNNSIFRTVNILKGVSQIGNNTGINFIFYTVYMLILIIIFGIVFSYAVKRRLRDELY